MRQGMLWFDNDSKLSLSEIVERAASYYFRKYGRAPDLCLLNPAMFNEMPLDEVRVSTGKITLRPMRTILPRHLWIGLNDKERVPLTPTLATKKPKKTS